MVRKRKLKITEKTTSWLSLCKDSFPCVSSAGLWPEPFQITGLKKWLKNLTNGGIGAHEDRLWCCVFEPGPAHNQPSCPQGGEPPSAELSPEGQNSLGGGFSTLCSWDQLPGRCRRTNGACAVSFLTPVCLVCIGFQDLVNWLLTVCILFPQSHCAPFQSTPTFPGKYSAKTVVSLGIRKD